MSWSPLWVSLVFTILATQILAWVVVWCLQTHTHTPLFKLILVGNLTCCISEPKRKVSDVFLDNDTILDLGKLKNLFVIKKKKKLDQKSWILYSFGKVNIIWKIFHSLSNFMFHIRVLILVLCSTYNHSNWIILLIIPMRS